MPTDQNAYNSRVTDESLEKRFRDTFTSQGGAELVSDLYASGVIVPTVDFTAAATGDVLAENLQTAWDFSTGQQGVNNTTANIITTPGFWRIGITVSSDTTNPGNVIVSINDGITNKPVWEYRIAIGSGGFSDDFVGFVRSGDTVVLTSNQSNVFGEAWYRQIADVNGNLVNPLGFTSS